MSTNPVTVESINPQVEKLEALKNLFPEAFSEGKLDTTLLSATLGESISNERESYGMSWAGKSDARKQIVTPTTNTLSPDEASSVDFASTDNILIEGDNLEVLKLLQKSYTKQVKMIYIDPPYNTGKDFVYHDNFHASIAEYEEASGQRDSEGAKLVQNTETNGRYHSDWLSMMYPRLHLARNLLRDDGVIFVSIDDNEVHNLRKIMDEIYGEENFEGHIHWRRRHNQPNDKTKMIGLVTEHILAYAKNSVEYKKSGVGKIDITGSFSNPDNDPRGDWASKPWKTGSDQSGTTYKITSPTGKIFEEEWMGELATFKLLLDDNRIIFPKKGDGVPRKKYFRSEREEEGQCATNWWSHEEFGHNQGANELCFNLFGQKNVFSNPKPIELIRGLLQISNSKNNDIILDFFAGSGSTGHAVMSLNEEDGEKRKFILVQFPENLEESLRLSDSSGKKVIQNAIDFLDSIDKPHFISEITAERLRRAGKKIKEENPNVSFDSGFRLYRLTPSCYQVASVEYNSEDSQITLDSLERAIQSGISPLRDGVIQADVIVENLIKEGFLLNSRLENIQIGDNHFLYSEREGKRIYMSFESDISMSTIQSLSREYSEAIFVVYDKALDDSRKVMMSDRVKLRTI